MNDCDDAIFNPGFSAPPPTRPRLAAAHHRSVDSDSQNVRGAPVNRYPVGFACQ